MDRLKSAQKFHFGIRKCMFVAAAWFFLYVFILKGKNPTIANVSFWIWGYFVIVDVWARIDHRRAKKRHLRNLHIQKCVNELSKEL